MDEQLKTLLQLLSYHNKTMKTILKPGTLKNYETSERYLKNIIESKFPLTGKLCFSIFCLLDKYHEILHGRKLNPLIYYL